MQVSDNINTFVSTAEGAARDTPPDQISVPSVTELSRDAFVLGVSSTQFVREHIKLHLLHPARLEEDDSEAQVCLVVSGLRNRCVVIFGSLKIIVFKPPRTWSSRDAFVLGVSWEPAAYSAGTYQAVTAAPSKAVSNVQEEDDSAQVS